MFSTLKTLFAVVSFISFLFYFEKYFLNTLYTKQSLTTEKKANNYKMLNSAKVI